MNEGRVPPQAVDVEENILGTIMLDSESVDTAFSIITADDFYKPSHRDVFGTIQSLYRRNDPIDALTVCEELREENKLDEVGGEGFVWGLTDKSTSSNNLEYLCSIIQEKSTRRNLINHCQEILKECYDNTTDTGDVVDRAQSKVFSVTESQQSTMEFIGDGIHRTLQEILTIQENGQPLGLRTGLDIDNTLQGFQGSKLYMIGARPSMGKTALILTMARRFARDEKSSGVLSLETSKKALHIRFLSQVSNVPAERITSGQMTSHEVDAIKRAVEELERYGVVLDDQPALSIEQVRSKCRLMARKGVDIIFIDFLTLIKADGRSKHEEVGEITKVLKQVSKELDIPVVVLSQLSRKVEDRTDKRPQMADLRESGSIEEDADAILFLYRPEYYGKEVDEEGNSTAGICEVIIAKNKDGKTGTQRQLFIAESMKFENISPKHKAESILKQMENNPGF